MSLQRYHYLKPLHHLHSLHTLDTPTEIKGFKPDVGDIEKLGGTDNEKLVEEESSSDTTDAEEAGDIEELLNPGDPVYFNYATDQNSPTSLTVSFEKSVGFGVLHLIYNAKIEGAP